MSQNTCDPQCHSCKCTCKTEEVNVDSVDFRKIDLTTPKYRSVLLPGEELALDIPVNTLQEGQHVLLQPHLNAKPVSNVTDWVTTSIQRVNNGKLAIRNDSGAVQHIAGKDTIAHAFPMIDPRELP